MTGWSAPSLRAVAVALSILAFGDALFATSGRPDSTGPTPAVPASAAAIEEPVFIPAGVVDVAGTIACLRTPEGGVETIDPATGRSFWRAAAPARALLVARGRVFVLEGGDGGRLRLSARAARTGRPIRTYELATLPLPQWASPAGSGDPRAPTGFEAAARLEGDTLEIRYDATRWHVSGFRSPSVAERVEGVARIGLESGRVEVRPGPAPPRPLSEPAPPMPGVRPIAVHARKSDATLMLGGPPPQIDGVLVAGDRRYLFELSPDAKNVTVHRWKAGGGKPGTPLHIDHGHATDALWVTLDRGHLLLRRAHDQRRYDLYALDTGAPIGSLERPVDAAVVGPRIYWTAVEPDGRVVLTATGTAMGTETGRRLWRRTVREADRRPPGPPIP